MAIFSYMVGDRVSRGAGQSAVKVAAYQARENYTDVRTGYAYNHRPREQSGQEPARGIAVASAYIGREAGYDEGRKPVLFVGLYGPKEAPDWCRGRENIEQFWSRAELAEGRQDAQIAERIIIALPHELTLKQNIWLLQDHVKEFTRQGRGVQVAIHAPEHGDGRNIHAHLLVSTRGVDRDGFKASKADGQHRYLHRREYVQGLRARWAEATNRHLARHGNAARVDHRTLKEQGIERAPTIHLGPGDSRRERHGERSVGGEVNREVAARNAAREPRARETHEGHERVRELTGPHARPQRTAREAAEAREAERAPQVPAAANPAPDAPQRGRERQKVSVLERSGRMIRSAFEKALDWVAPRVEDPHLQPPPHYREPEKPAPERPLPLYERIALKAQEREEGRDRDPGFRRDDSPLYERYKAEREAAWQARQAVEREVHDRFTAYTQDLRGFYQMRFAQEKHSGMPGPVRHDAMELLAAQRRGDRGHAIRLEREQLAEVRRAHPLPDWGSWLKGEAEKGDREAVRTLERHEAREAERNCDRDDDGRGIEP